MKCLLSWSAVVDGCCCGQLLWLSVVVVSCCGYVCCSGQLLWICLL
jgi:hypothetical protein